MELHKTLPFNVLKSKNKIYLKKNLFLFFLTLSL